MTKEQLMDSIWDIYTRCQEAGMETVFYEDSGIDDDMNLEAYSEKELGQIYRDLVSKGYEDEDLYIDYENGVDWEPGRYQSHLRESVSSSHLESLIDELESSIQSAIQTAEQLANAFGGRVKANMERYMIPQLETILEGGPAAGGMDAIPDLKDDVLDGDVADWSRDVDESVQDPRKKDTNVETKSPLDENTSTRKMSRKINIREALNKIDYTTYNKYDLLNMYEALTLSESDKKDLVYLIEKKNFYAINTFLSKKLSKRG